MTTPQSKKSPSYQPVESAETVAPAREAAPVSLSQDQEILVKAFAKSLTDAMQDARAATLPGEIDQRAISAALQYSEIKRALETFIEKQREQQLNRRSSNV